MPRQIEAKLYLDRANLALQQASDNLDLGYYDVATSRAYYAMFYATSALLGQQGHLAQQTHWGTFSLWRVFRQAWSDRAPIQQNVVNAFNVRLDSDYEVKLSFNRALAEDILRDARQFVERATVYLQREGSL